MAKEGQAPKQQAAEEGVAATAAGGSKKSDQGPGPNDGGGPYSPSQAVESMEVGEKEKPPALTLEERAVQAIQKKAAAVGKGATADESGGDVSEKCRQYISRAKAKAVEDIKACLGKELLTYEAINNGNRKMMMASNILGDNITTAPEVKGWVELGDGRFLSGGLNMALNTWKIISTSFDDDWTCLRCGQHGSRPAFKIRGEADSSCSVQVVVLADQSFPPILPSQSNENCIKILLIENGSLEDLVKEFIRKIGNRRVPPGTTILLFSASHLGTVGTVAYAEDYLEAERSLKEKFGAQTRVGPLPPILLAGCDNPMLIRSIYEVGFGSRTTSQRSQHTWRSLMLQLFTRWMSLVKGSWTRRREE
jgi:hypothetical protein